MCLQWDGHQHQECLRLAEELGERRDAGEACILEAVTRVRCSRKRADIRHADGFEAKRERRRRRLQVAEIVGGWVDELRIGDDRLHILPFRPGGMSTSRSMVAANCHCANVTSLGNSMLPPATTQYVL